MTQHHEGYIEEAPAEVTPREGRARGRHDLEKGGDCGEAT